MDHEIEYRPTFATLEVALAADEEIVAEAGALVSHSDGVRIETGARGGVFGALKRAFGGESFFVNTYAAPDGGQVTFAPPLPGDVVHRPLADESLIVQSGSYLAAGTDVRVNSRWGGAKTFLGGEGLFMLELSGTGPAFLSSYGAIHPVELADGEQFTVDTGHLVAFEPSVDYRIETIGGLKSTLFSGEGVVSTFTGPGTLWLQTRSHDALVAWLAPKLGGIGRGRDVGAAPGSFSHGTNERFDPDGGDRWS